MSFDIDHFCRTLALEAADAVIYADGTGMIAFWNKGAGRIFGYSEAEALGRSLDIIIPERLRRRHWEGYDRTMRTGRRSEEHTSELQSLMRISYAVFCLNKTIIITT